MRHGLAPPVRGVFMIMDFAGDAISNSCMLGLRICLLGELVLADVCGVCLGFRVDVVGFSWADMARGSGDEE